MQWLVSVVIYFCVFCIMPSVCTAAWYLAQPQPTDKQIELPDTQYDFKLGDISCGAKQTRFDKLPPPDFDRINESRELFCWASEDTYVSVSLSCDLPKNTAIALKIKKGKAFYMPLLICSPHK